MKQWPEKKARIPKKPYVTWSNDERFKLIRTRIKHDSYFHGSEYSKLEGWKQIVIDCEFSKNKDIKSCKQQWKNLMKKYNTFFANGNDDDDDWPFYDILHNFSSNKIHSSTSLDLQSSNDSMSIISTQLETATPLAAQTYLNKQNKCGEIYLTNDGIFNWICTICDQNYLICEKFIGHIYDEHSLKMMPQLTANILDPLSFVAVKNDNSFSSAKQDLEENNMSQSQDIVIDNLIIENLCFDETKTDFITNIDDAEDDDDEEIQDNIESNDDASSNNSLFMDDFCMSIEYQYNCDICNRSYKQEKRLIRHRRMHETLKCQHCHKYFDNIIKFEEHDQTICANQIKFESESDELKISHASRFNCKYCVKKFKKLSSLKLHEIKHRTLPFKCDICSKSFVDKTFLRVHLRIHSDEKRYRCEYCPAAFKMSGNLKRHILTHTGQRNFQCRYNCNKAFFTNRDRAGHEIFHTGNKEYVCEICGKSYVKHHHLTLHKKRSHTDRKFWPHKCNQCDRTFTEPKELREHIFVHTGERPNVCEICGRGFRKQKNLREHLKLHSNVKTHICKICNRAFAQSAGLSGHMKSHDVIKMKKCDI